MEEVCKRFPGLAEDIIAKIDHQSLNRFKESNRGVSEFLDKGKCLWKRMILKHISGNFQLQLSKNHFISLYVIYPWSHRIPLDLGGKQKGQSTLEDDQCIVPY